LSSLLPVFVFNARLNRSARFIPPPAAIVKVKPGEFALVDKEHKLSEGSGAVGGVLVST
jgi:hypothetical protein